MGIFDQKPSNNNPTPGWMRALLILFILYAIATGYQSANHPENPNPQLAIENYPALENFVSAERWQTILDPEYGSELEYSEREIGVGDYAACGQRVRLQIELQELPDTVLPEEFEVPDEPITYMIGDATVHRLWDRAVRGMRKGGKRRILAGPRLLGLDPSTPQTNLPVFLIELLELTPFLAEDATSFEYQTMVNGKGIPVSCGDRIKLRVQLLNQENDIVYDSVTPIDMVVGETALGHGIDRGVIGLKPEGVRRLHIPPAYLPREKTAIPFPEDEIAIVDILAMPYIKPESTSEE